METLAKNTHKADQWGSKIFVIAASFMLINTILLWGRYYSPLKLSILWAAIPAIIALAFGVVGLFMLYQRASGIAPKTAKIGLGFAALACAALGVTTLWIVSVSVFGAGLPQPVPQGLLLLIVVFMLSVVLAFSSNAVLFLLQRETPQIGYLLAVPVVMWATMLVVGLLSGMEVGLSLDYYTNGVIAVAFFKLGLALKPSRSVDS